MHKSQEKTNFWNWSLKVYGNPVTKNACLHLQDEFGLDVNTLLWLCWLASTYQSPTPQALDRCADISHKWNQGLTKNVRSARKSLGHNLSDTASQLKTDLLKLELQFEHKQQSELEHIPTKKAPPNIISKTELCQHNLNMLLAAHGISSTKCTKATHNLCRSIFEPS